MLPVKWMPPEAFLDGVFTSKTDSKWTKHGITVLTSIFLIDSLELWCSSLGSHVNGIHALSWSWQPRGDAFGD